MTDNPELKAFRRLALIGVLIALMGLLLSGCNQAERDASAAKLEQGSAVIDQAMSHLTVDNVGRALDMVITLAPVIGREDLAAKARLLNSGPAEDAVVEARSIMAELASDLDAAAIDLRDPGTPTWQIVLNAALGVLGIGASVAAARGVSWAGTARRVIAGVEAATESGSLPRDQRARVMRSVLTEADERRVNRALARSKIRGELDRARKGIAETP